MYECNMYANKLTNLLFILKIIIIFVLKVLKFITSGAIAPTTSKCTN